MDTYEKKYKEIVGQIKKAYLYAQTDSTKAVLEEIFPELKKPEDEEIRKGLIENFKWFCGDYPETAKWGKDDNLLVKDIIAWLKKQGQTFTKEDTDNANKVEPKFKAGNWYQCTKDFFGKGVTFDKNTAYYCAQEGCLQNEYGCHIAIVKDLYDNFKLWAIKDAKDGDVLIDKSGSREGIFIFKETKPSDIKTDVLNNPLTVLGYCGIGGAGFTKGSGWGDTANCTYYPATKEQRDLLFQKIHEAGYEWDSETKELKKISQRIISAEAKEAMYGKPAWSEEDEVRINRIVACLENLNVADNDILLKDVNWLKSLKERI